MAGPLMFRQIPRNREGRTFAIGDLHGHFDLLDEALEKIGFDKTKDLLLSSGDMVDRGPKSERIADFVGQPWFRAVRGNHEQMLLEEGHDTYRVQNGASWWLCLNHVEKAELRAVMGSLPIAMEIETAKGRIGIVHADVPYLNWTRFTTELLDYWNKILVNSAIWERSRWMRGAPEEFVSGIDYVVAGHTPSDATRFNGNVLNMDTACGYDGGQLTVIDLDTFEIAIQLPCPHFRAATPFAEPWMR